MGGRVEGGYRFAMTNDFGFTPYAAYQVQSLRMPGYSETSPTGFAGFALGYNAKTTTASRSELGARFDSSYAAGSDALWVLRGRIAWAYDFSADQSANAFFQIMPGTGFTVLGAASTQNSALAMAAAEFRLANGVSFLAKFDGQFSDNTQVYVGTAAVRV
jgi:outer membrane autotransporter protein